MAGRQVIIDTDPGQDDAFALLLALAAPELDILGITTVAGNVPVALSHENTRKICELAGRTDVPVFGGCSRPLLQPLLTAEHIHGSTGLDGADLPAPTMPLQERHAAQWIVEAVRAAPDGAVTLCPLGPLTNIAVALAIAPDVAARLAGIVLMGGGAFSGGNITPAAEFNIHTDPHAAAAVFACGAPITMMPLDVTHKALIPPGWSDRLRAQGTRTGQATAGMLDFYRRDNPARYGQSGGPLHDPCVTAWLVQPELFDGKLCNVRIETGSPLTMGMTVVDWWNVTGLPQNARVITDLDAPGFFSLLETRLATLP